MLSNLLIFAITRRIWSKVWCGILFLLCLYLTYLT